jgi:superfamily II helicase
VLLSLLLWVLQSKMSGLTTTETTKIEAKHSSKKSVPIYHLTKLSIPEDFKDLMLRFFKMYQIINPDIIHPALS